jgi:rare lipoprotein A
VIVRINDRGPFHDGRIIDLSYAAAYRLGIIGTGSGEVEVEAIVPGAPQRMESAAAESVPITAAVQPIATTPLKGEPLAPETAAAPGVFLQVGAFSSRDNAEQLRARLPASERPGELVQLDNLWRVQLGPYGSPDEARGAAERLEPTLGLKPLVVVR